MEFHWEIAAPMKDKTKTMINMIIMNRIIVTIPTFEISVIASPIDKA